MRKKYAEISDAEGNKDVVFEITPDLADAFIAAIRNVVGVEPPRYADTFNDLIATIAQTSHVIQHMEAFRELAMVAADRTSPHADRKSIAIAAAMPPSRLYRVLEKHGQPRDRKAQPAEIDSTALPHAFVPGGVMPGHCKCGYPPEASCHTNRATET